MHKDDNLLITVQIPKDEAVAFRKVLLDLRWDILREITGSDANADVLHFILSRFQIALMDIDSK